MFIVSSIFCFGKFGAFINDNSKIETLVKILFLHIFYEYCKKV